MELPASRPLHHEVTHVVRSSQPPRYQGPSSLSSGRREATSNRQNTVAPAVSPARTSAGLREFWSLFAAAGVAAAAEDDDAATAADDGASEDAEDGIDIGDADDAIGAEPAVDGAS